MQARGATCREILSAGACRQVLRRVSCLHVCTGEWRSKGFLAYLDSDQLEDDAVVEAHLDESSGSEEED